MLQLGHQVMKGQPFPSLKCKMFLISPRNQVVLIYVYFFFPWLKDVSDVCSGCWHLISCS